MKNEMVFHTKDNPVVLRITGDEEGHYLLIGEQSHYDYNLALCESIEAVKRVIKERVSYPDGRYSSVYWDRIRMSNWDATSYGQKEIRKIEYDAIRIRVMKVEK